MRQLLVFCDKYNNRANSLLTSAFRRHTAPLEATAFTVMMAAGAAPPKDEVDFVLDRPFLFAIISETGQLLFVGVVNQV